MNTNNTSHLLRIDLPEGRPPDNPLANALNPSGSESPLSSRFARRAGKNLRLADSDQRILEIIHAARFLTGEQLHALVGGNKNSLQVRLRKLFDAGYIDRPQPQRELASRRGTAAIVYALGPRGAAYLGEPVKRNHEVGSFFLRHVLLVSRVYTTMAQACARTGVHLTQWVNEYPLPVLELPGIREAPHLKADAFFILAYRNSYATFFLEVDRGTEPGQRADLEKQSSLLRKIVYYQELFRRREEFGVRNLRVLALVPSERRLEHYLDLARGADPEGKGLGVFWGTTHDQLPQEEPGRLFSADIWHTPTRGPLPLLP